MSMGTAVKMTTREGFDQFFISGTLILGQYFVGHGVKVVQRGHLI